MEFKPKDQKKHQEDWDKSTRKDSSIFKSYRQFMNYYIGNHYKKSSRVTNEFNKRFKHNSQDNDLDVRVTRNHIHHIASNAVNSVLTLAPDVSPMPNSETEMQDIKAAELHDSIYEFHKSKDRYDEKKRLAVKDLVVAGEAWWFINWNPNLGDVVGTDEEGMEVRTGLVETKRILPYNVRIDPSADSKSEAAWMGFEELMDYQELKSQVDESLHDKLEADKGNYITYSGGQYKEHKEKKVKVNYKFYKPCAKHPKGKYCVFTGSVIIHEENELPLGIFPLIHMDYDEMPNSARSVSIVKQLIPFQVLINKAISSAVKHWITLGDDKLILNAGSTLQRGASVPGVRTLVVNGEKPTILAGRNGSQYIETIAQNTEAMYKVSNMYELLEEKNSGQFDAITELSRTAKQKARFTIYAEKFENFLKEACEITLKLYKANLSDDAFVKLVGRSERVNIPEFKASDDLSFQIKVKPGNEDAESRLGKYLVLRDSMQYLGGQMSQEQVGQVLRNLAFVNGEEIFSESTSKYDRAKNIILALDRGEAVMITESDPDVDYIIPKLYARTNKADFQYFDESIKANYDAAIEAYEMAKAAQMEKLKRAESEFLPTDGALVPVEGLYKETIGSKGQVKHERVKLPLAALQELQKRLEQQGFFTDQFSNMPQGLQAQVADQFLQNQQQQQQPIATESMPNPQGNNVGEY
jgi:hypothetical protein